MHAPADMSSCPHCGHRLLRVTMPDNSGWQEPYHLVCFNDECAYYTRGWDWMYEKYAVRASYRYRLDPTSGAESPLPVWSNTAHRDRIVEDDAIAAADGHEPKTVGTSPGNDGADDVIPGDSTGVGGDS